MPPSSHPTNTIKASIISTRIPFFAIVDSFFSEVMIMYSQYKLGFWKYKDGMWGYRAKPLGLLQEVLLDTTNTFGFCYLNLLSLNALSTTQTLDIDMANAANIGLS